MGTLIYGGVEQYDFDDRTLSHLKVVIAAKFRRQESFMMSWTKSAESGGGRMSIWLTPTVSLSFVFSGSRSPEINEDWVRLLSKLSNTPRGLIVSSEQEAMAHLSKSHG